MIRLQIIEREGTDLRRRLIEAMRSGTLRTFSVTRRGKRVVHTRSPGWMNWSSASGVISCEIRSPQKPGMEWDFLKNLVGRLADKFADHIQSISIQFPDASAPKRKRKRRRRK
jgi:hypothetical protein